MLPLIKSPPSLSPLTPPSLKVFTDNGWPPLEEEEETELLDSEEWPNVEQLVTEDEVPVDNFPSAKQQRLLIDSLYSSWHSSAGLFLADANIGIFSSPKQPPIVPDVFVSLNTQVAADWWQKRHRSYFIWEFGKPPEVVIELVSNRVGQEDTTKLQYYAKIGIRYYLIFDSQTQLSDNPLRIYELRGLNYVALTEGWLAQIELGVTLWHGPYENKIDWWLRWCDQEGRLILTGAERAKEEHLRAEQERHRAEQEHLRAEQEHLRAERLAAKLRELGISELTF